MRILVLQHHSAEHPGIFRKFMADNGIQWDPVHLHDGEPLPSLDGYDAVIAMGGPMDTWEEDKYEWMAPEKAFIRQVVVEHELPFLGCCLGHQLLAEAVGGKCEPMQVPEVGVLDVELTPSGRDDQLFRDVTSRFKSLQWHGAQVTRVPDDCVILAESPACAIQSFRVGDRAWGMQFHIETDDTTVDEWGKIPAYAEALEEALGEDALPRMRDELGRNLAETKQHARAIHDAFIRAARG